MIDWLLDPFAYSFMVRALIATIIVAIVCSILGSYVILKGMAFLGDALAHTILPGVVIAYLLNLPLTLGALVMGIITALAIGTLSNQTDLKEDTAIGVLFAGLFALGVALLSISQSYSVDLAHFLFGNLLGVSSTDLWMMAILSIIVLLTLFFFYKEFLVITFDPILATTLQLPVPFFSYLLLILLAITIVISLQVVGIALMVAMLVTPAATASLLTKRVPSMMGVSTIVGILSGIIGLYSSFYMNIASGPAVVLTATLFFLLAFLFAPEKGLLWKKR